MRWGHSLNKDIEQFTADISIVAICRTVTQVLVQGSASGLTHRQEGRGRPYTQTGAMPQYDQWPGWRQGVGLHSVLTATYMHTHAEMCTKSTLSNAYLIWAVSM